MRTCPACHAALRTMAMSGEEIDRCPDCGGAFYDQGELERIVGLVRLLQGVVLREEEIDTVPTQERSRALCCPADGSPMSPRDVGGLIMDTCERCGGIWLDSGEITALKLADRNIRQNLGLYVRLGS